MTASLTSTGVDTYQAGHVLQVKHHASTDAHAAGTLYLNSSSQWDATSTNYWSTIVTTQASSSLLGHSTVNFYAAAGTVSGGWGRSTTYFRISPNSNMSGATDGIMASSYIDARSTNGTSGQETNPTTGSYLFTQSAAAGTTYYYTIKHISLLSGLEERAQLTITEIAT